MVDLGCQKPPTSRLDFPHRFASPLKEKHEEPAAISLKRSSRRAQQVGKYLPSDGIELVTMRGWGGAAPVASNGTALVRRKNRRVEVWVKIPSAPRHQHTPRISVPPKRFDPWATWERNRGSSGMGVILMGHTGFSISMKRCSSANSAANRSPRA